MPFAGPASPDPDCEDAGPSSTGKPSWRTLSPHHTINPSINLSLTLPSVNRFGGFVLSFLPSTTAITIANSQIPTSLFIASSRFLFRLSISHVNVYVPTLDWPTAPFPHFHFPFLFASVSCITNLLYPPSPVSRHAYQGPHIARTSPTATVVSSA